MNKHTVPVQQHSKKWNFTNHFFHIVFSTLFALFVFSFPAIPFYCTCDILCKDYTFACWVNLLLNCTLHKIFNIN